jgi:Fic family protein
MYENNVDRLFQKQVNAYRLQELIEALVSGACLGSRFVFEPSLCKQLHSVVMHRLIDAPGQYRQGPVHITNSPHIPPVWVEVEGHMAGLCDYLCRNWESRDLVHLAAFVLWRLNWIHPFPDGNGRTSRAAAYMVMQVKYGGILPSKNSIIQQIVEDRQPYYQALRDADDLAAETGDIDSAVRPLEQLLSLMLKEQIKANL